MKTFAESIHIPFVQLFSHQRKSLVSKFKNWVKEQEASWEYYRLGISAVGIAIQVTFAGAMLATLAMAGASPYVYSVGIFFSFMANSIAFGQCQMRLVLGVIAASIFLDILLITYYLFQ